MVETKRKIAVLIDADNMPPSYIEKALNEISKLGILLIRRAYGDWSASNMGSWKDIERTCSVQLIQQSRYVAGKNATDMAILIDAMDILYSGKVDTFCLMSSDSDFTPLAIRLRDEGCQVVGVGNKKTNEAFINACSQFITMDSLLVDPTEKPAAELPKLAPPTVTKRPIKTMEAPKITKKPKVPQVLNPVSLLKKAYQVSPQEDGWVFLGLLGHSLHQLDAAFKPNQYGHSTLIKLVRAYPDLFEIKGNNAKVYVKLKS
jgi:NYN domain/OST-HTH/LOTUS domain